MKGITKSDKEFIKQLQQEIKPVAVALSKMISSVNKHRSSFTLRSMSYDNAAWSVVRNVEESIESINNQLLKLNYEFITGIERYFKTKYNVYFRDYEFSTRGIKLLKLQPLINPEIVVANILDQIKSLDDAAIATMKRQLKRMLCEQSTSKTLVFDGMYYRSIDQGNSNTINAILMALAMQEHNDFEVDRYHIKPNYLNLEQAYVYKDSKVLDKLRFYKSSKCRVTFKTTEAKEEFTKLYEL